MGQKSGDQTQSAQEALSEGDIPSQGSQDKESPLTGAL